MDRSGLVWAWWVRGKTGNAFEKRYHSLNYILAVYWFCVANWTLVNTHFRIKLLFLCPLCMPATANSAAGHPPTQHIVFYTLAIIPFLTDHCLTHTRISTTMHIGQYSKEELTGINVCIHTCIYRDMLLHIFLCPYISSCKKTPLTTASTYFLTRSTCWPSMCYCMWLLAIGVAWRLNGGIGIVGSLQKKLIILLL